MEVAYARPAAETSAGDFIEEHNIKALLGRVLDSQENDYFDKHYETSDGTVGVNLYYDWEYGLTSREEAGDDEGMSFLLLANHYIGLGDINGNNTLEYRYTITIPEDSRLIPDASHDWKVIGDDGMSIDGPEFKPEQMESSGDTNDELFIALLQRGCEDLAYALTD